MFTNDFSCKTKIIRRLQNQNFDLTVSLYNVNQGLGYSNIDLLAWATKPKSLRSFNSKNQFKEFSGKNVFKKILRERLSLIWIILNALLTLILFLAITIGIITEWLLRKIMRGRFKKLSTLEPIKLSSQR